MRNNPMMGINPMQMLQQFRSNPMQFIRQAGFNVPENLSNPNDIIQHLMNSGQVSQDAYNRARQMAAQFKK